MKKITYMC